MVPFWKEPPHIVIYGGSQPPPPPPPFVYSQWLEYQQTKEFNFSSTTSYKHIKIEDVTTSIIFPDKENSTKREISPNYINKHPLSKV